ncbi:MAG: hypothetical protein Q7T10_18285 [Rhodoferax sp.]|uniref:hypothetical protein n=1 Tax=Rhodoferax sp. TaxID=50421 RepID=UPI0027213B9A|nr:hypothetical protein [Rhodoferax sp.]MDO8450744.1 hypothetical protein [Rhodoferax sp.]
MELPILNTDMNPFQEKRMFPVLVASSSGDLTAEVLSAAVVRCDDMRLMGDRVISLAEIEGLLAQLPPLSACALLLVGRSTDTEQIERCWLSKFKRLIVLRINIVDDLVSVAVRRVGMRGLMGAIRSLVRDAEGAVECVAANTTFTDQ